MQVLIYEVPTVVDEKIPVPNDYENSSTVISQQIIQELNNLGNKKLLAHLSCADGNCRIVVTNSAGESRLYLTVYVEVNVALNELNKLRDTLKQALHQAYAQCDSSYLTFVKQTQAVVVSAEQNAKLNLLVRHRSNLQCFA